MSFVYAGIKVRKDVPAAIRDQFVVDEHNKTDPATGSVNVYRRITMPISVTTFMLRPRKSAKSVKMEK